MGSARINYQEAEPGDSATLCVFGSDDTMINRQWIRSSPFIFKHSTWRAKVSKGCAKEYQKFAIEILVLRADAR